MRVEIQIEEGCQEPRLVIVAGKMTDEVAELARQLSGERPQVLAGCQAEVWRVLDPAEIYRVYAQDGKVLAETSGGVYTLRQRLYELEERLGRHFVRISNSEIVNLKKVKSFDLSFTGTIQVRLTNGATAYVSRRYVNKIKEVLGV